MKILPENYNINEHRNARMSSAVKDIFELDTTEQAERFIDILGLLNVNECEEEVMT